MAHVDEMDATDPVENSPGPQRRAALRTALRFAGAASLGLLIVIGLIGIAARFEFFGAGFHINFALALGVLGTVLLGVGLMALSFYSDRSGADDQVLGMGEETGDLEGR